MGDLVFRPATPDDATFAADVITAVRPASPVDPVLLRYDWENESDAWLARRFIVEGDGRRVGFAWIGRPREYGDGPRFADMGGELLPDLRAELMGPTFAAMEQRAAESGARTLRMWANEDDPTKIAVLHARRYAESRRGRRWELDLVANRERLVGMAEESRSRMRREGVRLLTLAQDEDPDRHAKIWRMSEEATQDIPTTIPHVPESLEDYMRWFRRPDVLADRFWLARLGDDVVGVSVLTYPPVRGLVGTAWTATARSVRGRGVARALKLETVLQAIALGVERVRTGNDAQNEPILHINETMGYRQTPGSIEFLKDVSDGAQEKNG